MGSGVIALWRRRFLVVEPLAVLLAVGGLVYWAEWQSGRATLDEYLRGTRGAFYSTVAGLSGSLLGFVIAAFAITVSAFGSRRLRPVDGHIATLIATFSMATAYLGSATLVALVALVVDQDSRPAPWLFYTVLLLVGLSSVSVARCVWILHNVVSIVGAPSKSRAADE